MQGGGENSSKKKNNKNQQDDDDDFFKEETTIEKNKGPNKLLKELEQKILVKKRLKNAINGLNDQHEILTENMIRTYVNEILFMSNDEKDVYKQQLLSSLKKDTLYKSVKKIKKKEEEK